VPATEGAKGFLGFELATRDAAFRAVPELVLRRW
jgi:hypothetical protein